jgi:DNA polymerase III delta subunit
MTDSSNHSTACYFDFINNLTKGILDSQYLYLFGPQQRIKQILTNTIKKHIQKKHHQYETEILYGDHLSLQDFLQTMDDNGFFSVNKLVILRNASTFLSKNVSALITKKVFADMSSEQYLIFEDEGDKNSIKKAFKKELSHFAFLDDPLVPEKVIIRWVRKKYQDFSLHPPLELIKKCIAENNQNLDLIFDVTERICLENVGIENPVWDKAFVLHKPSIEEVIFSLSDTIVSGEKEKAFHILDNLIRNGKSYDEIFFYLLNHFAFLVETGFYVSKGMHTYEIEKKLPHIHSYRMKMAVKQLSNISYENITNGYNMLLKIDQNRKKGIGLSLSDALVLFIEKN